MLKYVKLTQANRNNNKLNCYELRTNKYYSSRIIDFNNKLYKRIIKKQYN
jgi:hypothetical protein